MMKPIFPLLLLLCPGTALWCDGSANAQDAAAPDAPAVDAPAPDAPAPFEVPNADMTEGGDVPTGWTQPAKRSGIKATRDTTVFRSAPASLCLSGTNPDPNFATNFGTARLTIHNGDTKTFTLSGFVGSEPGILRSLSILYTSEGTLHSSSINLPPHEAKWLPFSRTFTLPSDVTEFSLGFGMGGGAGTPGSMTSK